MASPLAKAHIAAEERLRATTVRLVTRIWRSLPGYDRPNLDQWLSTVLPVVLAAQTASVALTEGYLARVLGRQPLGVNPAEVIAATRRGTPPAEVYERPFVTVWSTLQGGRDYEDAISAGLARAKSAAATDAQLSMRETLRQVGDDVDLILGYQRVPDGRACDFCRKVAGMRYLTSELMPIHPHCGCGVDVITGPERPSFYGGADSGYDRDLFQHRADLPEGVAIRDHGELGPVLTDPSHDFTSAQALA